MIEHFNVINIESYYDSLLLTFRNKLRKKILIFLNIYLTIQGLFHIQVRSIYSY